MLGVTVITLVYVAFIWLAFFKFKLLRLTPGWGVFSIFFILHLVLVPMAGMRFFAPYTTDMRVVRNTIQVIPRLPEPTRVAAVYVRENQPVKKGDILFVFDQTLYASQVRSAEANLVSAQQNAKVLEANIGIAKDAADRSAANLAFAQVQQKRYADLASQRAASQQSADEWTTRVASAEAELAKNLEEQKRAELQFAAQIDGINTKVIEAEEALAQARYYLEQTELRAPKDGVIVNLQVQEGMVSGTLRLGAIASLVVDENPYLLAAYRQENLKFVKPGQDVVIALNTHPGEHFHGKVESIWWASRKGQYLPSGDLPLFPDIPINREVRFPVKITMDDPTVPLPIGVQGATLILTDPSNPFTWLGQISLRTYTWARWLYPLPF